MNNKSFIIALVTLIGVISVAGIFYNKLNAENKPNNFIINTSSSSVSNQNSADGTSNVVDTEEKEPILIPNFSFEDESGEVIEIHSKIGKPMVINVWATWCGPCKIEMPYFQQAYEKYGDKIDFVMINATATGDTIAKAKNFAESNKYTFPLYYDTKGEAMYALNAIAIPTTYLVSSEGEPVVQATGVVDEKAFMDALAILVDL